MTEQREIKFRVWHKDGRKNPDKWMRGPFDLIDFSNDQSGYEPENKYWDGYGEEWVFMQYTGLKDKNGKEIYEGDVVRRDCVNFNGVVEWYEQLAAFGTGLSMDVGEDFSSMEVIGNIYENPDLVSGSVSR